MHSAAALILAGGFSSRMHGFKALLALPTPEGSCSALECLARTYRAAGVTHIWVVSGHRAEEVEAEAQRLGLNSVRNPSPEQGMFSSVCVGLRAMQRHHDYCFVHPVDIPLVRPLSLRLLWEARLQQRPCLPTFRRLEGHPLLLPVSLWDAALAWQGERGLHGWLHALAASESLEHVPVPDRLVLCDMDTDAAYALMCRLATRYPILEPTECRELLRMRGVRERGLAHGRGVGRVAAALAARWRKLADLHEDGGTCATSLLGQDCPDTALCLSGGLLHDLCKGQPQHEQAAGELLRGLHLPLMAALVEEHRDMQLAVETPIGEKALVYLADKYVEGDKPVTLAQRFGEKLRLFEQDAPALQAVKNRWRHAEVMEARLHSMLGESPATLARQILRRAGEL
ncbi:MAG: nucleotidyltransferase family protein [Desulfovibrionaceae bacterium]